jgi:hypothetical protein
MIVYIITNTFFRGEANIANTNYRIKLKTFMLMQINININTTQYADASK